MKPLIQALARASINFTGIKKDGQALAGGTRPYSYMTLDEILAIVRPALAAENLFLWHDPKLDNQILEVNCHVSDGEFTLSNTVALPVQFPEKANRAQVMGSLLTYGKRYSVCALLGISADIDDDAQATTSNDTAPEAQPKPRPAAAPSGPRIVPAAVIKPAEPHYEPEPEPQASAVIDKDELHRLELFEKVKELCATNKIKSGVILEKTGMAASMLERASLNDLMRSYKVLQQYVIQQQAAAAVNQI
jgi:hypothetical protein